MYKQLKDGLFDAFMLIGGNDLSYVLAERINAFKPFSKLEVERLCGFIREFIADTPEVNSVVKSYIKQLVKAASY